MLQTLALLCCHRKFVILWLSHASLLPQAPLLIIGRGSAARGLLPVVLLD